MRGRLTSASVTSIRHWQLTAMSQSLPGTEAGLRLNGSAPAAWQFVSDAQRNAFGQPRGYAVAFTCGSSS